MKGGDVLAGLCPQMTMSRLWRTSRASGASRPPSVILTAVSAAAPQIERSRPHAPIRCQRRMLATPLRSDAAHRIFQPVGRVDAVEIWTDLGAEPAPGEGMIGIAVEADGTAIPHLDQGGAGVRAVVRAGTADDGGVG